MIDPARDEARRILAGLHGGREDRVELFNRLFELTFVELRRLAAAALRHEQSDLEMQPGDLVDETYMRLAGDATLHWTSRAHFCGVAAVAMRQILVEAARRRGAAKRGGGWQRITLDDEVGAAGNTTLEILDLDQALLRLKESHARMEQVVELRVFGGLAVRDVAHVLGVSERTVQSDWRAARTWLAHELSSSPPDDSAARRAARSCRSRRSQKVSRSEDERSGTSGSML